MAEIWIPPKLQQLTGGKQQVQVEGTTVRRLINNLEAQYPGIKEFLVDEMEDDLIAGIAVIVDGEVSLLGMLEKVSENAEVHFLPAIGGGCPGQL
jgi:molybdopterin synthase sulfur carrier subunit|tara:strand:+ start:275 stop:559 length:285 start_codon:yes stop_codon:yes gene_type:complete